MKFPMPNDALDGRIVVASVDYFDDERGAVALVLLLEPEAPYFTVAHYALTDIAEDAGNVGMVAGELDILGRHSNIVPAIEDYSSSGGDY